MQEEKKYLLSVIERVRNKLNQKKLLHNLCEGLIVGGGITAAILLLSCFVPMYYGNLAAMICFGLCVLSIFAVTFSKRITRKEAALYVDSCGFQERVITAWENLDREEAIYEMQRANAVACLENNQDKVKVFLWPKKKRLLLLAGVLVLMAGLYVLPTPAKETAEKRHEVQEAAKEKQKEIQKAKEELEKLKELPLSEEELNKINHMLDSFQASMKELDQATSMEAVNKAGQKLDYKYNEASTMLNTMASQTVNPDYQQALNQAAAQMPQGNGIPGNQMAGNGQGDPNQAGGQNGQTGGQPGNQGQATPNGQGTATPNGNAQQNGQQGNGQQGQGNGQGNGQNPNGQGAGQGEGAGQGQGGQGNGNGGGAGAGRGEGSSLNGPHDYVSVPNALGSDENLTGDAMNSPSSNYYRQQNGISWDGKHVDAQSVIGNYQERAYDGISKGRYPKGMSQVIKQYFGSFE